MTEKLVTPCPAPKRGLPWELKYDYAIGGWADSTHRGNLSIIRQKYGAAAAVDSFTRVCKEDDRVKNLTNTILTTFFLKGNDVETIGEVIDIWDELTGIESTILERSKFINKRKVVKCPWKTQNKDISDWNIPFMDIVTKTINPKVTFGRPKAMCAGDLHCEYVWKLEENGQSKGEELPIFNKLDTPCASPKRGISWELKYNFAMRNFTDFAKGYVHANRDKYGPSAALEIFDLNCKEGDRVKNLSKLIQQIFNLDGIDAVTIGEVIDVWDEICGYENIIIERSESVNRRKVTKCPWTVKYKDVGNYAWYFKDQMGKGVNPKATLEMPKKMCAGDPYCDYIWRIEE
jgi:hypothetical protein